jgi:hypothetical protein
VRACSERLPQQAVVRWFVTEMTVAVVAMIHLDAVAVGMADIRPVPDIRPAVVKPTVAAGSLEVGTDKARRTSVAAGLHHLARPRAAILLRLAADADTDERSRPEEHRMHRRHQHQRQADRADEADSQDNRKAGMGKDGLVVAVPVAAAVVIVALWPAVLLLTVAVAVPGVVALAPLRFAPVPRCAAVVPSPLASLAPRPVVASLAVAVR